VSDRPLGDGDARALADLVATARHDVDRGWLPACQLAVARDGELLTFETLGDAAPGTRFCIFSATKPLVASAVWHLLASGDLHLDDAVGAHVPELAADGPGRATVEQVLLHTSGFPHAPMYPVEGGEATDRRRRFAGWRLEWEPGSRFEYHATSAHWVLADLIERVTGDDFRDVIEERVCRPLGLPRLLGPTVAGAGDIAPLTWVGDGAGTHGAGDLSFTWDDPDVVASGTPGAGGVATAADLALFYQALLHNPGGLWDAAVLEDATSNVRCTLPEPLFDVAVNRTIGLVVAGDDGLHVMRYGAFAERNSPAAFGHAGAHVQVAWADPETGVSFSYLTNGLDTNTMKEGARGLRLSNLAASIGR
jgi:CubicO group peptidase (beta-lactamase class C family)